MTTIEQISQFLATDFPQCDSVIEAVGDRSATMRHRIGVCQLIKVGRSLVVGDVYLFSEGDERAVAHAVGTYSIPPARTSPEGESAV